MGPERRLSDGRAKLCGCAIATRQANGSRTAAAAARKVAARSFIAPAHIRINSYKGVDKRLGFVARASRSRRNEGIKSYTYIWVRNERERPRGIAIHIGVRPAGDRQLSSAAFDCC